MSETVHLAAFNDIGRIVFIVGGPPDSVEASLGLNTRLPYVVLPTAPDSALHYVKDGELHDRPEGVAQLQGNRLSGVPAGASIIIGDVAYTADGETIELGFDYPGTYVIKVLAWPAQDQELSFENPA